jgi:putative FmdB family regulatory protein
VTLLRGFSVPTYSWECEACNEITEVVRKFDEMDVGPAWCSACQQTTLRRVILGPRSSKVKGYILEGGGWHADEYTRYRSIK